MEASFLTGELAVYGVSLVLGPDVMSGFFLLPQRRPGKAFLCKKNLFFVRKYLTE